MIQNSQYNQQQTNTSNSLDEFTFLEYSLSLENVDGKEADVLAQQIHQFIESELKRYYPDLFNNFDLGLEEYDIIYGSRKSKAKRKLKEKVREKRHRTVVDLLKKTSFVVATTFTLLSADYTTIQTNWETIREKVETTFSQNGVDVKIDDSRINNPGDDPAASPDKDDIL